MQLSLSYEVFRWHSLDITLQLASYVFSTLSYVANYHCTLSLASQFLALADMKPFSCSYSEITAASDWP